MEPLELALRTYQGLSPIDYLRGTHDARVHDIAFDGKTFVLQSESWVGTDPNPPIADKNFLVIFSRYRAEFKNVRDFKLVAVDRQLEHWQHLSPAEHSPTLAEFMQEEIREFSIELPLVSVRTDDYEIQFTCKSFDVERFAPTKQDYQ